MYKMEPIVSVVVSSILAIGVFFTLDTLFLKLPMQLEFARRWLDPRARFEGFWISKTIKMGDPYFNFVTVIYDSAEEAYSVCGYAVDSTFSFHSVWVGGDIDYRHSKGRVRFYYTASMEETVEIAVLDAGAGEMIAGREIVDVLGFAQIIFQKTRDRRYMTGNGFIVDTGSDLDKYRISFERIGPKEIHDLIEKKEPTSDEDRSLLIKKYCDAHSGFIEPSPGVQGPSVHSNEEAI
ncbi:MAG: hypothetical protein GY835_03030 [bacterium]|nr:hypothetical protein [bacterium]